jgi:hypothetical protein
VRTLSSSDVARVGAALRTVSRRLRRFAFRYDALEHRQLLSVAQSAAAAGAPVHQLVAQPAVAIAPLFNSSSPTGLSPSEVRNAYGANQISFGSVTGDGAGQTIAIVDAYYDPNIASDLQAFDAQYGLQSPGSFTQYVQRGLWQIDSGWALETALDVEWAHAMAPAANIVLVEAQPTLNDMLSAVTFASQLPGVSVVSMSWGASEFSGESAYNNVFTTPAGHNGVTFVAASGDSGTTEFPSASPNVLSVGGTTLDVTSQGNYVSEAPWSNTGTGTSPFESQPAWQAAAASAAGLSSSGRTTPDVSFVADPSTGVSVYDSIPYYGFGRTSWYTVGGTSVGAPAWAGLIAVANQGLALNGVGSLSNAQSSLYQVSSTVFNHPSTAGSSSTAYALTTGLGSPKANLVVSALVQLNTPGIAHPGPVTTATLTTTVATHKNDVVTTSPSSPTTSNTTNTLSSTSTSTISITALNPTGTPTSGRPALAPVIIVPAPAPPVVLHLGSSSAPVLAQMIHSAIEQQAEQPTSLTHFGQALETELQKMLKLPTSAEPEAPALIDVVEPFQPLNPADAPKGENTQGPVGGWQTQGLSPFAVDSLIEASNGGLFPLASLDLFSRAKRCLGETKAWEFSTLFGAVAVATGGFHLAMRESCRFKTRWLPGRAASTFPTKRWGAFRGR